MDGVTGAIYVDGVTGASDMDGVTSATCVDCYAGRHGLLVEVSNAAGWQSPRSGGAVRQPDTVVPARDRQMGESDDGSTDDGLPEPADGLLTSAVARLGAGVGFVVTYIPPFRWTMGPRSRWWEPLRRVSSRVSGSLYDDRAGPREITAAEYAGTLPLSRAESERVLWAVGFRRNPLARLKTRDGDPELSSWVYREGPLADRQLHLMLFPGREGTDVYAHEEPSSANPLVGAEHLSGSAQHVARGVERARERLPLEQARETPTPPAGPWSLAE